MHYQRLGTHNWTHWRETILLLEAQIYEPSRQDTPETVEHIICDERGISLAAVEGGRLPGFCLGSGYAARILPWIWTDCQDSALDLWGGCQASATHLDRLPPWM